MRASGRHVATPHHPSVATSGRTPGRAAHGLGELLARIADEGHLPDDAPAADAATTSPPARPLDVVA